MAGFRKYKIITTAFLLVLYAFIATPVQLWHHHAPFAKAAQIPGKLNQDDATITIKGQSNSVDCSICSNEYAIYNNDAVTLQIIKVKGRGTTNTYHLLSITAPPYTGIFNKGPPVLA